MPTTKDQAEQSVSHQPQELLQNIPEMGKQRLAAPWDENLLPASATARRARDLCPCPHRYLLSSVFQSGRGPWAAPPIRNAAVHKEGDREMKLRALSAPEKSGSFSTGSSGTEHQGAWGAFHSRRNESLTYYQSLLHFPMEGKKYFKLPVSFQGVAFFLTEYTCHDALPPQFWKILRISQSCHLKWC